MSNSDWGRSKYEGLTFDIDDLDYDDSPNYSSEEEEEISKTFRQALNMSFPSPTQPKGGLPCFHTLFPPSPSHSVPKVVPASPCSSYSMSPCSGSPFLLSLPPPPASVSTHFDENTLLVENVIPDDVLPLVCSYLGARELLTIGMASKDMNKISNDPELWVRLVSSVFGTEVDQLSPPDAQEVYKIMNRRLRDLKNGLMEGVWNKEMKLRAHSI
mmetsp:Transcript_16101/g.33011  ORF Transcript_16101/g.33011 Transcript_16101/m.33011 type:complete len:214 (-) Transcript_16101:27-668(-)